jgi:hypothetical protein
MRFFTAVLGKLTYANVAATLALVLALSGTAYAASLGKDTVGSKQIKNNSVSTKDVKDKSLTGDDVADGSVTGADVADGSLSGGDLAGNSITGAQVNEGTLGAVPNAAALGGFAAADYARSTPSAAGNFTSASPLSLTVAGYGTYQLKCNASTVAFNYTNNLGNDANEAVQITAASGPTNDATTRIHNQDAATGALFGHEGNRIYVDALIRSASGAKAIRMALRGWSTGASTCFGFIEGQILR